jgi:autotransporter-associated beta strand protein
VGDGIYDDQGTVVLTNTNTYMGGTTIDRAVLEVAADSNLGLTNGNLTLDGGYLITTADGFSTSRSITITMFNGGLAADTGTTATYNGVVGGPGELVVGDGIDSGTVVLTNFGNDYAGGTEVLGATLQVAYDDNLGGGNLTLDDGELLTTASGYVGSMFTTSKTVDLFNSNPGIVGILAAHDGTIANYNGVVYGPGALQVGDGIGDDSGTVVLTNTNTYMGPTTIDDAVLKVASDTNLGLGNSITLEGQGELLTTGTNFSTDKSVQLDPHYLGILAAAPGTTATYNGVLSGSGDLEIGDGNIYTTNEGTVVLTNTNNDYTNGTFITLATLEVAHDSNLGGGGNINGRVTFYGGELLTS